ncbi:MAG: hypothetical protein OEV55_02315 [candidate division Zixibacteria bacterium]|nr:hypothetical protein [candidate division Zixibacteria bacterium]
MNAVIGFIGVIIGAGIGLIPYFIERKEKYKFESYKNELERKLEEFKKDLEIKYEVRIKTHQEAFAWLMDFHVVLNSGDEARMRKNAEQARDWWNKNCFFLDENSRGKFMALTNMVYAYARDFKSSDPDARKISKTVWSLLDETIDAVFSGLKAERLPVLEKLGERKRS